MGKNKKSDKEDFPVITNTGTIILDWMEVQSFSRKGNNTLFIKDDNSKITALLPFEYYLEQIKGIDYLAQCNDDTVVNFHFVKSIRDGNGNEL